MSHLDVFFFKNPLPMWIYDANTKIFLEVNETAISHYGFSREEFLKMKTSDIEMEAPQLNDKPMQNAKNTPLLEYSGQKKHKLKTGRVIDVEIISQPLEFNGRQAILEVSCDISRRKKTEQALKKSNKELHESLKLLQKAQHQLIQQENLRILGTLASGIAHDFNNALSSILGYSDLLLQHPDMLEDKNKVIHALKIINSAALDASKIVARLREFYKKKETLQSLAPLDLNKAINDALELTRPRWENQAQMEGILYEIFCDLKEIPEILGSESEIREMLTNLILNALDAMPAGGKLFFRTHTKKEKVILEIEDTGIGMSEEVQAECFKPFFSTKGEKGSGLGLSLVSEIVKRHEATIHVKSILGKGTCFTLVFPIKEKAATKKKSFLDENEEVSFRILLVEDQPAVREIFSEYLFSEGHIVETASDGKEGLQKFNPMLHDVVILDRAMPGMSGEKLASAIKKIAPEKPIILLTGSNDLVNGENPLFDIDIVLVKPISLSDLREALSKVTAKFKQTNPEGKQS
jgi:PAS domain S-box-containing protein